MINYLFPNSLSYSREKKCFYDNVSNDEVLKYLKGVYKTKNKFDKEFLVKIKSSFLNDLRKFFNDSFDDCIEFTYEEALN
jgi:hypothetical protein